MMLLMKVMVSPKRLRLSMFATSPMELRSSDLINLTQSLRSSRRPARALSSISLTSDLLRKSETNLYGMLKHTGKQKKILLLKTDIFSGGTPALEKALAGDGELLSYSDG